MERVAFAIPTFNEAPLIGLAIASVPVAELAKDRYETAEYVVDGRSADLTRDFAVQKGARVITEERSGKGAAILTAFRAVDADSVIVVDGVNTYLISVVTEMTRLLQANDVVIGSRLKGSVEPGAMTRLNVVGEYPPFAPRVDPVWATYQRRVHGFWAYRSDVSKEGTSLCT